MQPTDAQETGAARGVMHVITGLGVGGAETMLTSLILAERDFFPEANSRVVSLSRGGANVALLKDAGVKVTELDMRPDSLPGWELFRLARLICLEKPAIVQSWMYHADLAATLALYWSDRRRSTRLIWGLRCSDMDTRQYGLRLRAVIQGCVLLSSTPDSIVSNSIAGQTYHTRIGYPENRFVVIPNGIDIDRFQPKPAVRQVVRAELGIDPDKPVIAHVARVDPMKDHSCFLNALKRVPDVTALMIGQGTERLPHQPGILRLGRRDDVPRLLCAADLIVSSSAFGEGFSNSIAEGMAAGLPAVATDTGDAKYLVGDTGAVVPPRNSEALAAAILMLLSDRKSDLPARSAAARARIVDRFSLRQAVISFRGLYAAA